MILACRTRWWVFVVAVALVTSGCACGSTKICQVDDDCWNTEVSTSLGRCAPRIVACIESECHAACGALCRVVDPTINPCSQPKRICNQSQSGSEGEAFCTPYRSPCVSAEDCPLYRPVTENGAQHRWVCSSGLCEYPGLRFEWD